MERRLYTNHTVLNGNDRTKLYEPGREYGFTMAFIASLIIWAIIYTAVAVVR